MSLGMLINMKYCTGCDACTLACKAAHGNPAAMFFTHVDVRETGEFPDAVETRRPVACNHCDAAPCVEVCPTGASVKYDNGVVGIDKERCTGCGTCLGACPYGARTLNEGGLYFDEPTAFEQLASQGLVEDVMYKCDWCAERRARDEKPACVQTCPAQARLFGDVDDPASEIAQALEKYADQMEELDAASETLPRLYYVRA